MAPKEIIFSPNAEREVKKLQRADQERIFDALEEWRAEKLAPSIEKIKSQPDFYRLRLGNFRIVFYPLQEGRVVLLLIRDRKNAYKDLGNLPAKLATALRHLQAARG